MADIEFEDEIQGPQNLSRFSIEQQKQHHSFITSLLLKTGLIKDQKNASYVLLIIAIGVFATAIGIQVIPRLTKNNSMPISEILEITPPAPSQ
jgi:hypothetical protein